MLGSKSMDIKSASCLVPNPLTPRLLVARLQIHGHQDFWLLGSKYMDTKTFDHLAWGFHTHPFVAICNLANVSTTHLSNQTCLETIFYPGTLQDHDKAVHTLLLLSTHTLWVVLWWITITHWTHLYFSSLEDFAWRHLLLTQPQLVGWLHLKTVGNGRQFVALIFHQCLAHC